MGAGVLLPGARGRPRPAAWLRLTRYSFSGVFLLATGLAVGSLVAVALPRLPFEGTGEGRGIAVYDSSTVPVAVAVASWPSPTAP